LTTGTAAVVAELRAVEFPELDGVIHFNAASFSPLPRRSRLAIETALRQREAARLAEHDIFTTLGAARSTAASLIGADPAEIALTQNTTQGLNIAAAMLVQRAREGDRRRTIVVSRGEFPANVYVWLALRHFGYDVRFIDLRSDGSLDEAALCDAAGNDPGVAALAVSSVQFASGALADLVRLGAACAENGVLFVVDAIQQLGAVPLDVGAAHIDVLATGGHKWLCAPFGTGFAYVRRPLAQRYEPLLPGWLAFEASADFARLLEYRYDFIDDARRFELATLPISDFAGFTASLELLQQIGVAAISAHIRSVQAPLAAWAAGSGVEVLGRGAGASGIFSVRVARPDATAAALAAAGVHCVVREGAIRFAPHVYNTVEEAERIVDVLDHT
jgi:cysteine desulfurase / selenocysteine lyase